MTPIHRSKMRRGLKAGALSACAALLATFALVQPAAAQDPAQSSGVHVGGLTCDQSSGWGFIIGSSRSMDCVFTGSDGHEEHYVGTVSRFGMDIGYHGPSRLAWGVFAPTDRDNPGALAGQYGGLSAGGALGVGASAHAMLGGSEHTISLQPVSVEGDTGLNVAAGVASIELKYVPQG